MKIITQFKISSFLLFFTLLSLKMFAQNGTIKGTVKDATGAVLEGASITAQPGKIGTRTSIDGTYTVSIAAGNYTITSSYTGKVTDQKKVTVKADETNILDFILQETGDLTTVTVGSRVRDSRLKTSTAVPVDIIRTKDVMALAQADVAQILTYAAPSFQSNRQTVSDGTDHIDPASLRGLGPDQTLVLINGKRRHNTSLVNINGTVGRGSVGTDLNSIPAAAIERIEVLRDGAAAQYGSDAIAGVINIVLKKNYNGLNVSANFGANVTTQSTPSAYDLTQIKNNITDGTNKQIDIDWGMTGKNKTYINVAAQYLQRGSSNRGGYDNSPLLYYGSAGLGNLPATYSTSTSVPLRTDYFQWIMNQDAAKVASTGFDRRDMIYGNSDSKNFLAFINAGTNISSNVGLYSTFGIGYRNGDATGNYRLPSQISQQPIRADGSLYYPNGFLPHIAPVINDISFLIGSNIKAGKWDLDISNSIGKNTFQFFVTGSGNASLAANDNVQTSFDAGKVSFLQNTFNVDLSHKFDLNKTGNYFNLAFGSEFRYENFKIIEGEPNSYILGTRPTVGTAVLAPIYPFTNTAATISAATAATSPGSQVFPGFGLGDAVNAHRSVYAIYADGETKLDKLTLGTAIRFESYAEQTGDKYNNISGKFSARYEFNPAFAIRGSVSNGFRAPSLHQRYFHNTSTQFVGSLASNTLTINNQDAIARNGFGVEALKPETSVDFTLGFVGKVGNNFSYAIDAYQIDIKDRIVLSSAFPRSNALVATILTGVDPSTSNVQFWTNAIDTRTKGLDIVLTEKIPFKNLSSLTLSLAGNFNQNKIIGNQRASNTISSAVNNPSKLDDTKNPANDLENILFDRQQKSRIEVGQPNSKFNFTATYTVKKWSFILRAVHWGEITVLNTIGNDPNGIIKSTGLYYNDVSPQSDQTFSAKLTTDLAISYKPSSQLTLTIGSNNIFDIYPDQIFVDSRNSLKSVYANPVVTQAANAVVGQKAVGGYSATRDGTNRNRLLYSANQFGFNGRYIYFKISAELGKLLKITK